MSSSYPGAPKARDPGHPPVFGKRTGKDPGAPACVEEKKVLGTCLSLGDGSVWKPCHRSWREPLPEFLSNRTSEK
jgi:hypothetical protein